MPNAMTATIANAARIGTAKIALLLINPVATPESNSVGSIVGSSDRSDDDEDAISVVK